MKWQFVELQKYKQEAYPFEETIDLAEKLTTNFGDVIEAIEPVQVKGFAQADRTDIIVHAHVETTIVTPSTRSGKPFTLPLSFDIDEVYINAEANAERYEIEDSVILINDEVIDFDQAVAEYIVLQIPLQVLAPGEADEPMPAGNGWVVISEDDYQQQAVDQPKAANTPLAGLADLLKDED